LAVHGTGDFEVWFFFSKEISAVTDRGYQLVVFLSVVGNCPRFFLPFDCQLSVFGFYRVQFYELVPFSADVEVDFDFLFCGLPVSSTVKVLAPLLV